MKNLYKTCRWCRHFHKGCCTHSEAFRIDSEIVGTIYNLSNENHISERVRRILLNAVDRTKVEIINPEKFCCKYFD